MSQQGSPALSRRIAASPAASRRSEFALASPPSGRIGVAASPPSGSPPASRVGSDFRRSRSSPNLKLSQPDFGSPQKMTQGKMGSSAVLHTMATGLGAKISATLHHRGEDECGAIVDPNDKHVYVPRAQWTQSYDHPLKANNAQWNEQHYIAAELKRTCGEAKKFEYNKREVDDQLKERANMRAAMVNEKQQFADLVNADAARFQADMEHSKAETQKGYDMMRAGLGQQQSDMSRRAHDSRLREAQDAAECRLRTVQQMCEEMNEQKRKKKQMNSDMLKGVAQNEANRRQAKADKHDEDEKMRQEFREGMMQDEYRLQATAHRLAGAQGNQNACVDLFDRTAGKADRDRESAELLRLENDEKKDLMRKDAFFGQRENARERQRHNMCLELDRQKQANEHRATRDRTARDAERLAVQQATRNSLDQEMAKGRHKLGEELELQNELRIMMAEKEERHRAEGFTKPSSLSTMNMVMMRNGNAANAMTGLQATLEAARYCEKPCGREANPGQEAMAPLDASPKKLRRLVKNDPLKGEVPIDTVLGGVVGTLGGGGGAIATALMALGGPMKPKSTGIAVQDRKLESHWHEGLSPDKLKAGKSEARRREAAKVEANGDFYGEGKSQRRDLKV